MVRLPQSTRCGRLFGVFKIVDSLEAMSWFHFELPSIGQAIFVVGVMMAFRWAKRKFYDLTKGLACICRKCDPTKRPILEENWKENMVYLYQFPRISFAPNLSPFCLKVESFLRLHKIPYEVRLSASSRSKYGLLPFIELNGEHIADSQLIINELTRHFKIEENLSARDLATAHFIDRSVEKHTLYLVSRWKMLNGAEQHVRTAFESFKMIPSQLLPLFLPVLTWYFKDKFTNTMTTILGGNFEEAEFKDLLNKDLGYIRDFLGDRKYLFGDKLTSVDVTLFSSLAVNFYAPIQHYAKDVLKRPENKTIVDYMERVKDEIWPDFTNAPSS